MGQNIPCQHILKELFYKLSKSNLFTQSNPTINNNPTIKIKPKTLHSLRLSNPKKPRAFALTKIFKQSILKPITNAKKPINFSVREIHNHERKIQISSSNHHMVLKNKANVSYKRNLDDQQNNCFLKRKTFKKYPRKSIKQTIEYHNLSTQQKENKDPFDQAALRSYSAIFKQNDNSKNMRNRKKKTILNRQHQRIGGWQFDLQQDDDLKMINFD